MQLCASPVEARLCNSTLSLQKMKAEEGDASDSCDYSEAVPPSTPSGVPCLLERTKAQTRHTIVMKSRNEAMHCRSFSTHHDTPRHTLTRATCAT